MSVSVHAHVCECVLAGACDLDRRRPVYPGPHFLHGRSLWEVKADQPQSAPTSPRPEGSFQAGSHYPQHRRQL